MRASLLSATLALAAISLAAPAVPRNGQALALQKRKALRLKHLESQSTNRALQQDTLVNESVDSRSKLAFAAAVNTTEESTSTTAPRDNIWASLSAYEASQVVEFLHNQTELNLTVSADAGS